MQSNFDPQAFFQSTQTTGGFSTAMTPVPEGDYPGVIKKYEGKRIPKKDGSGFFTAVDVTVSLDDARAREVTGLNEPSVRLSVFLDLTSEGKLDKSEGKNTQLGRLLEAVGLNDPNREWSWDDLVNKALLVKVEHTPNAKNPSDPPYANVTRVGKL